MSNPFDFDPEFYRGMRSAILLVGFLGACFIASAGVSIWFIGHSFGAW